MSPMRFLWIFLLFFTGNAFAQTMNKTDYAKWWRKIDTLINKEGNLKPALAEVRALQAAAGKAGLADQEVKAMLYRLQLEASVQEGSDTSAIIQLQAAIQKSKGVQQALYYCLLGDNLHQYYNSHRWNLYDRSAIAGGSQGDISTWSAADFHREIGAAYRAALANSTLLQSTPSASIAAMVSKGNTGNIRPTAYDLIAWHALDYFKQEPEEAIVSAQRFRISDPAALAPASRFTTLSLDHADNTHNHLTALRIFQSLLRFHQRTGNEAALVTADLDRLAFVHDNAVFSNKNRLYREALAGLPAAHPRYADRSVYLLALSYEDDAPQDRVKAVTLLRSIRDSHDLHTRAEAANLLTRLESPALTITTEKVNLPQQPFRALVSYTNIDRTHWRIYPMTETLRSSLRRGRELFQEKGWNEITRAKAIREWQQPLPLPTDYKGHSAEIKIDGLPVGEYILIASNNGDFRLQKSYMAAMVLHISNISYINRDTDYFIVDRNTGQPLPKAAIQTWKEKYDRGSRQYQLVKGERFIANEQGYVNLSLTDNSSVVLDVNYHDDRLALDEMVYHYQYRPDQPPATERDRAQTWFFLDRAIYRPGQLVHFKGIAVLRETNERSRPYAAQSVTVRLLNANQEVIDSVTVKTNDYGSYQGSFKLPESGLTGGFQLQQKEWSGSAWFRVEEYKRPKFQVEMLPVTGSYRVNDSIAVEGVAKAYAGNAIGNANITYRVTRRSRVIYYGRRFWPPVSGESEEIVNGTAVTDANGHFRIVFNAIPDPSIDRSVDPVFDYEVQADVTDLNGETRSAQRSLSVSYKALQVTIGQLASLLPVDSLRQIAVTTTNAGGQFEAAALELEVYAVSAPQRLVRKRYWEQPDQYVLDENQFLQYFPLDEYRSEADPLSWASGKQVHRQSFKSTADGRLNLSWTRRSGGWYRLVVTGLDRYGDSIRAEKTLYLLDPAGKQLPAPNALFTYLEKETAAPGETVQLLVGTATDAWLISQRENRSAATENNNLPFASRFLIEQVKPGIRKRSHTVTENDRGGWGWSHVYVQHNRVYASHDRVNVPWNDKQLKLSVTSFRDKLQPGSNETWTVTLKGEKGEQVAAEMLTSMYDASLDQFAFHQWSAPGIWPSYYNSRYWGGGANFGQQRGEASSPDLAYIDVPEQRYDNLLYMNVGLSRMLRGRVGGLVLNESVRMKSAKKEGYAMMAPAPGVEAAKATDARIVKDEEVKDSAEAGTTTGTPATGGNPSATRTDFRETAFFFPQLLADAAGNYQFSFTMPESLTNWKWQVLAHTKDLAFGQLTQTVITQKELMVQTNMPRFLREGDKMEITAKVVNMSDKELTGQAELQLIDPVTNDPVDGWFRNFFPNQYFTVAAGGSEAVRFPVEVPYLYDKALSWRIIARSGDYSDGESASLPVLTNRELVTETKPFFLNGNGNRHIVFEHLVNSKNSETLSSQSLTVEFSSNPAWYAVQALPYLNDYPYECAEQTFNRLYANLLAAHIVNKMPAIRQVLETWKGKDTAALLSNLQKNAELKQVLLEETPWVLSAKNETEQKQKIAALFDLVRLSANTQKIAGQLKEMQTESGGFSWFKGGRDDRYITQYILTGIGRLKMMGALPAALKEIPAIVNEAIPYLDRAIRDDYDKRDRKNEQAANLNEYAAQYLYMRSYFPEIGIEGPAVPAASYFRKQSQQHWIRGSRLVRGMIATMLHRTGDKITAQKVLQSLSGSAVESEEMGMYWKDNVPAYYWQQAPIETQAMMIEAFQTIKPGGKEVAALKTWLLKNKQASHWPSTKATADACYALLLQGGNWLEAAPKISVQLGDVTTITASGAEAGTGYYQQKIPGTGVHPEMGQINIQVTNATAAGKQPPVWGAVYWQYFENMDQIEAAASPLSLNKEVFAERLTGKGPVLEKYTGDQPLKVGDKVKIRITLKADREMEYVHVKDLRASNLEPADVLSGYQWQGGLGYYQAPRDASMNFFISRLPKGTYVFEYALFVNQAGVFSNGIAKAQSMYAPEFSSHSEAVQLRVE